MKRAHILAAAIALACCTMSASAEPPANQTALMDDVRTLSSAPFAGRRTGSDGNRLAQAFLVKRFGEVGLRPFGTGYAVPFSFTRSNSEGVKTNYASATNLVGYIPGSMQPARYLLVSAHYDHLGVRDGVVYPGADDNASGVAAMLALAAHFRQHRPLHTIVFAAFDAEELGSHGAQAFLDALPFGRDKLSMNLNLDMVSRNDNNEIWAAGLHHYPALKDIVTAAAGRSTVKVRLGHDVPVPAKPDDDWTDASDHGKFHKVGVPFLYFGVEDHADYHGPGDTADKINPLFYSKVVSLLVDVAETADQKLAAKK